MTIITITAEALLIGLESKFDGKFEGDETITVGESFRFRFGIFRLRERSGIPMLSKCVSTAMIVRAYST